MNYCLINYKRCGTASYSKSGLASLSKKLTDLMPVPFSTKDLIRDAETRYEKMSIQGVQTKLGAQLNILENRFEIIDVRSTFILKPQSTSFELLPENEAITMRMAEVCGIEIPVCGLVRANDGQCIYFIKRFDRLSNGERIRVEDFAQLSGGDRNQKYDSSMEKVAQIVGQFCTEPEIEKIKLFKLVLFNFLVGNEDAHLKNWSLIVRNGKTQLSPAYDLVNSTIALVGANVEEIALPINGKKRKLSRELLVDYYGKERLQLSESTIESVLNDFKKAFPTWQRLLKVCFLSMALKSNYMALLDQRKNILGIDEK